MRSEHLATPEALANFRAAFESGALPKAQWTHAAHASAAARLAWREPDLLPIPDREA